MPDTSTLGRRDFIARAATIAGGAALPLAHAFQLSRDCHTYTSVLPPAALWNALDE